MRATSEINNKAPSNVFVTVKYEQLVALIESSLLLTDEDKPLLKDYYKDKPAESLARAFNIFYSQEESYVTYMIDEVTKALADPSISESSSMKNQTQELLSKYSQRLQILKQLAKTAEPSHAS